MTSDFVLRMARREEDLEEVYRIRYRVYVEEFGYLSKELFLNNKESDEYDNFAMNFLALRSGVAVGTVRFIQRAKPGIGMRLEKLIDLSPHNLEGKNVCEVSRLILMRGARHGKILLEMLRSIYALLKQNNIERIYIDTFADSQENICLKIYKKLSFRCISHGYYDPKFKCKSTALMLDVSDGEMNLWRNCPKLASRFFTGIAGFRNPRTPAQRVIWAK